MMWRILLLSCCLGLANYSHGQLRQKTSEVRHLSLPDRSVQFQIGSENLRVVANNALVYYWVKGTDLHHSRGGFEGRLLHGKFTAFYPSQQLKSQGRFHKGRKHGEWKTWHENGELKSIANWSKGRQNGRAVEFDVKGQRIKQQSFRNSELHGRQIDYATDGSEITTIYKRGKKIEEPEKAVEIIEGTVTTSTTSDPQQDMKPSLFRRLFPKKEADDGADKKDSFFKRIFGKRKSNTETNNE